MTDPEPSLVDLLPLRGNVIRPGDTLVVELQGACTVAQADQLRERILALLPGLAGVVVLQGATIAAIWQPGHVAPCPTCGGRGMDQLGAMCEHCLGRGVLDDPQP